ncbi:hypothetical protein [Amycolatopsis pigmentata]|uniref:Uncharacterized protein n=1 Tax=Amycolatopsis pigmentata TaxID=450801 RepID=A0ABW5G1S4_9PSEU
MDLETVTVPPSYAHAVIEAWRRDLVSSDRAVEMMYGEISGPDLPPRENAEQEP